MPEEEPSQSPTERRIERDEEFASLYANNVLFETSVWDLKMIFGQLDLTRKPPTVEYHTAIAVPWLQAKIMSYYLQANLALYESEHGRLMIPPGVHPPPLEPMAEEHKSNPAALEARAFIEKLRKELISPE